MDSKQFAKKLSEKTGKTNQEIDLMIDGLVTVIKDKCAKMDSIAIPSFGTFEPKKRLERINTHPSSGKKILIPPKISLSFKASSVLKNKLRPDK
ncbi:MAG: HU family DNA-binding protein [Muribaculaceae bacterium]|nr:HU family DNA-binding protein [Muribaculaceae bacterium]